ncbi:MAG: M20 family metallopeptidase [Ignavibacteriales bacterium]
MTERSHDAEGQLNDLKARAVAEARAMAPELHALSDRIYHNPELGFSEFKASQWLSEFLASRGFEVELGLAGMDTAFRASASGASPGGVVALLAEYDALPEIGHGCGHNMIGVAACGAAAAVKGVLGELRGTVLVYGCPAEEGAVLGAGGKVVLVSRGYFDGVDAAMMIHPASRFVVSSRSLARAALKMVFSGGDAQSAAMLTFNAINALRQHLGLGARVHGVIGADNGPGVRADRAPEHCEVRAYVRAYETADLEDCEERVRDCALGAAMATGCQVDFAHTSPTYEEMVTNQELASAFTANLKALGVVVEEGLDAGTGSTDMGNVSHVTPSLHAYVATCPRGVAGHTREFGRATLTQGAHESMLTGVEALAMTVIDLLGNPSLLSRVRTEFERTVRI